MGLQSDAEIDGASSAFSDEAMSRLRRSISEQALQTRVLLTDRLSNRVLAVHLVGQSDEHLIAVNTRFRIDPDVLTHALIEEYVHSQQVLDGVAIETERTQFDYAERPYEQYAKRIATEILGYDPGAYEIILLRDEQPERLFDGIPESPSFP
jgi:hypothetical protein